MFNRISESRNSIFLFSFFHSKVFELRKISYDDTLTYLGFMTSQPVTRFYNSGIPDPKIFATLNEELKNINDCFMSNKLSLNVGKTKYSSFYKPIRVDNLLLKY